MNTSLKNARIFDDDAWEEKDGKEVKKEIKLEPRTDIDSKKNLNVQADYLNILNNIKMENQDIGIKIKKEPDNINNMFDQTLEDGEVRDCSSSDKLNDFRCKTPPSHLCNRIKPEIDVDAGFDESPYNKELFKILSIKEETPIITENEDSNDCSRNSLKSAKRTVFNRVSPYKRFDSYEVSEKRMSVKSRLGPTVSDQEMQRKQPREKGEIVLHPELMARREKQIEYGKNTIGYDNYIRLVPREERSSDDPQTPCKLKKYSRRGWDGLIKQWRLKLHKYDPDTDVEPVTDT